MTNELRQALQVAKSNLTIAAGHKSRDKTIEVSPSVFGVSPGQNEDHWSSVVKERLAKHLGD
jgi:hypothetical protein